MFALALSVFTHLTRHPTTPCVCFSRFSDFHVNEIDLEGNVLRLSDMGVPPTEVCYVWVLALVSLAFGYRVLFAVCCVLFAVCCVLCAVLCVLCCISFSFFISYSYILYFISVACPVISCLLPVILKSSTDGTISEHYYCRDISRGRRNEGAVLCSWRWSHPESP